MTLTKRPLLVPAVLTIALWIVGLVITHSFTDKIPHHPTDEQLFSWIKGNTNPILLGSWLWMVGCLTFLWFAALLRARLVEAEGSTSTYGTLAFAGAVAAAVFGMLIVAGDVGAAIDKDTIDATTAGAFHNSGDMFFVAAELMLIPFYLGTAVVALRTRVLPKVWAFFSILVAIVLVIGPIGWAALIFGTPVWLLGTGLLVGRAARTTRRVNELAPA
ncbi:MAG TPA: hypothetical protein VFA97_06340 [Gaiellaceae bacterium]|nr:hypothetical protein [Gaiellaceae bacterium]